MNRLIKTAALALTAFTAFGENKEMNFRVEFPFTVGNAVMPAGHYIISETAADNPSLALRSVDTKRTAFLMLPVRRDAAASESNRSVIFHCREQNCSLHKVLNLRPGEVVSGFTPKNGNFVAIRATRAKVQAE